MGLNQEIESQRIEPGYNQTGKKKKKKEVISCPRIKLQLNMGQGRGSGKRILEV